MSSPTLSKLPLLGETDTHFVHLVHGLLTPIECATLIKAQSASLIAVSGAYSTRLRHIFQDEKLSQQLWDRLKNFYQTRIVIDEEGQKWRATGLNTHFRFCKYKPGDAFGPHVDGKRLVTVNEQSFMTVNIYLNTVSKDAGGATRVLSAPSSLSNFDVKEKFDVLGHIRPEEGMAAIFRDSLFHDGEVLRGGEKFLLRTDIMFERDESFDFDLLYGNLNKEARGKKALDLALRLEDGGNSNGAVEWYRKAFKLDPTLERGG